MQRLYKVFEPIGESKADWQITWNWRTAWAPHWTYTHPADIMAEVASLSEMFAGVTYDRLTGFQSLQWPVAPDGTDQPLLYTKSFIFRTERRRLFPLEWNEPCEKQDEEYDIHLNNGRLIEHFHEGNMTYRVKGFEKRRRSDFWKFRRSWRRSAASRAEPGSMSHHALARFA